jgi:hypothetical protein
MFGFYFESEGSVKQALLRFVDFCQRCGHHRMIRGKVERWSSVEEEETARIQCEYSTIQGTRGYDASCGAQAHDAAIAGLFVNPLPN